MCALDQYLPCRFFVFLLGGWGWGWGVWGVGVGVGGWGVGIYSFLCCRLWLSGSYLPGIARACIVVAKYEYVSHGLIIYTCAKGNRSIKEKVKRDVAHRKNSNIKRKKIHQRKTIKGKVRQDTVIINVIPHVMDSFTTVYLYATVKPVCNDHL